MDTQLPGRPRRLDASRKHGKPEAARVRDPQPDSREHEVLHLLHLEPPAATRPWAKA
jgi:hypothetical protein